MLMSRAIDEIDVGNASSFPQFLIAMVVCAAVGSLCVRYRARIMDTAGRSAIAYMREALFNHIQDLSFNFFDSRSAGKIMVRVINDINSLNDLFTNGIVNVFIDCVTLILLLVLMFVVNWKLTLISMCLAAVPAADPLRPQAQDAPELAGRAQQDLQHERLPAREPLRHARDRGLYPRG